MGKLGISFFYLKLVLVPEDAPIRVNDTLNNEAGDEERECYAVPKGRSKIGKRANRRQQQQVSRSDAVGAIGIRRNKG